jgi:glutamyl-tRNA reductase
MSDNINKKNDIWLIGAGYMATEYAKVLEGLKRSYTVIGKGRAHAEQFRKDTGHEVIEGGIQAYLAQNGIAALRMQSSRQIPTRSRRLPSG